MLQHSALCFNRVAPTWKTSCGPAATASKNTEKFCKLGPTPIIKALVCDTGKPDGACREAESIQKSSPRRQLSGFNKTTKRVERMLLIVKCKKVLLVFFLWRTKHVTISISMDHAGLERNAAIRGARPPDVKMKFVF